MSGHSKWATTKRQKAVVDAKRGALFTKIGNQIAIAARSGTDPTMNPSLAMVLEKARLANMPKANIERAIARVEDKNAAALIEETYEAYGPGGVGIIIEVATDNKNRTAANVRSAFSKGGGSIGTSGCVSFMFDEKGQILIDKEECDMDPDDLMMIALDAGADDFTEDEDSYEVLTAPDDFAAVREALEKEGIPMASAEITMIPQNYVKLTDETDINNLNRILDLLDEDDDVQNVYHNWEE